MGAPAHRAMSMAPGVGGGGERVEEDAARLCEAEDPQRATEAHPRHEARPEPRPSDGRSGADGLHRQADLGVGVAEVLEERVHHREAEVVAELVEDEEEGHGHRAGAAEVGDERLPDRRGERARRRRRLVRLGRGQREPEEEEEEQPECAEHDRPRQPGRGEDGQRPRDQHPDAVPHDPQPGRRPHLVRGAAPRRRRRRGRCPGWRRGRRTRVRWRRWFPPRPPPAPSVPRRPGPGRRR